MTRILSTVLAVIPAIALGFLSFWLYTERPKPVLMARADTPAEDMAPATTSPAAITDDVVEAEAAPGTPSTASDPATPASDAMRFEEERLANLRESLAELNEESLENAAGASTRRTATSRRRVTTAARVIREWLTLASRCSKPRSGV